MTLYRLTYAVPYEGENSLDFDSLEQAAKWIESNRSTYDFDLDNITLIEVG
ncbi:MAG: hypothetical protein KDK08_05360 [Rhizobiaceae bacterium]|nr:hypothetical protein [Rhizobiaceae bacterium]MCC0000897.1 hypothetical protein [Methylobacteriaceae bacterium]